MTILLAFTALLSVAGTAAVLSDVKSVAAVLATDKISRDTLSLTGTVLRTNNSLNREFSLEDDSGAIPLRNLVNYREPIAARGDRIAITGRFAREMGELFADALTCRILGHGPEPEPTPVRVSDIFRGRVDNRLVRIAGTVRDAFPDEIDPDYAYAILSDGGESVCLTFCAADGETKALFEPMNLSALVGATLSTDGIVSFAPVGSRALRGRHVVVSTMPNVLVPAPLDPFDAPDLEAIDRGTPPEALSRLDRHRVTGTVRAVWNATHLLVQTKRGTLVNVECPTAPLPACGTCVDVVGLPATDLYRRNLVRARWRPATSGTDPVTEEPTNVSARAILTSRDGKPKVQIGYHGRRVRMKGVVTTAAASYPGLRLLLDSDGLPATLDATATPTALADLRPGCRLEVTGVCIVETENWQTQTPFPHITGLTIALTGIRDVTVLARPPWWTPARFALFAGLLLLLLGGLTVWNRILRHLIDRRSRELLREQISRTEAELRLNERTRLAGELHDSVAQNLTGISLQIDAAERFAETDLVRMKKHLTFASRSLHSCRDELRNCLWDLRSLSLDSPDLATALQKAIQPHVGDAELRIRFPVPRAQLSDQTAHAIFRIVRELAVNAHRHGHASLIKITGSLDAEQLLFSVEDNGCGFDPPSAPGITQGHFGLLGIRERVRTLNGRLTFESHPGRGTYARVSLPRKAPKEDKLNL